MKVLVTAGPTREAIDPARYLSNRSSGKMGYALAAAARDAGHSVVLISGPTSLPPVEGVRIVPVGSAQEMHDAVQTNFDACDALVMAAAVADWMPATVQPHKVKKGAAEWTLRLVPTVDILSSVSQRKAHRIVVGFAAESQHVVEEARRKCEAKGCDLVVANDILQSDAGFDVDTNRVVLLYADGREERWPLMSKQEVAMRLVRVLPSLSSSR